MHWISCATREGVDELIASLAGAVQAQTEAADDAPVAPCPRADVAASRAASPGPPQFLRARLLEVSRCMDGSRKAS